MQKYSEKEKNEYEQGSRKDIENTMRATFSEKAKQTYCTELGMSETIIEPLIHQMQEGF